jgi:hypothetical protein
MGSMSQRVGVRKDNERYTARGVRRVARDRYEQQR